MLVGGITAVTVYWTAVNAAASARLFAKRHVVFYTTVSYARGHHGLHGARVMLSVRIADPLSGRRAGS